MNRAWVAPMRLLAAIAAIGVAMTTGAFAHDIGVAPPTADECRQFQADLASERKNNYAHALWREGEAWFDGHCFPRDTWLGIDLVERAILNGAEDAALLLRELYEEIGDVANADKWGRLTAIVLFVKYRDRVCEDINEMPLPADVVSEWRAIIEFMSAGNSARIVERLDALAARPPILPLTEALYWVRSTQALELIGGGEGTYQWARAALTGRLPRVELPTALRALGVAADCGHPGAARDQVQRFLLDLQISGPPSLAVQALARAHHSIGQFGDLLAAAERKLGQPAFRHPSELSREIETAEVRCRRDRP